MDAPVHELTVTLSDEEYELLQSFAATHGIKDLESATPTLIHDQSWDAQFAALPDLLHEMVEKARAEYLAGTLEDFDPNTDPDLQ